MKKHGTSRKTSRSARRLRLHRTTLRELTSHDLLRAAAGGSSDPYDCRGTATTWVACPEP